MSGISDSAVRTLTFSGSSGQGSTLPIFHFNNSNLPLHSFILSTPNPLRRLAPYYHHSLQKSFFPSSYPPPSSSSYILVLYTTSLPPSPNPTPFLFLSTTPRLYSKSNNQRPPSSPSPPLHTTPLPQPSDPPSQRVRKPLSHSSTYRLRQQATKVELGGIQWSLNNKKQQQEYCLERKGRVEVVWTECRLHRRNDT